MKSQKLAVKRAMTRQGIEVKTCQSKMRELVAFLKRNGAFFLSLSLWVLDFIEVHV